MDMRSNKVKVEPTEIICHITQVSKHLKEKFLDRCLFNSLTYHYYVGIAETKVAANPCWLDAD